MPHLSRNGLDGECPIPRSSRGSPDGECDRETGECGISCAPEDALSKPAHRAGRIQPRASACALNPRLDSAGPLGRYGDAEVESRDSG
jgi:hypothetical protein